MTHLSVPRDYASTLVRATADSTLLGAYTPLPGASPVAAIRRYFCKYAVFFGRASRSEYWWIVLLSTVVYGVGGALAGATQITTAGVSHFGGVITEVSIGAGLIGTFLLVYFLATILPTISLSVRRLHDVGLSGWFVLLGLVPILGSITLFVLFLLSSNPAGQRFDKR